MTVLIHLQKALFLYCKITNHDLKKTKFRTQLNFIDPVKKFNCQFFCQQVLVRCLNWGGSEWGGSRFPPLTPGPAPVPSPSPPGGYKWGRRSVTDMPGSDRAHRNTDARNQPTVATRPDRSDGPDRTDGRIRTDTERVRMVFCCAEKKEESAPCAPK